MKIIHEDKKRKLQLKDTTVTRPMGWHSQLSPGTSGGSGGDAGSGGACGESLEHQNVSEEYVGRNKCKLDTFNTNDLTGTWGENVYDAIKDFFTLTGDCEWDKFSWYLTYMRAEVGKNIARLYLDLDKLLHDTSWMDNSRDEYWINASKKKKAEASKMVSEIEKLLGQFGEVETRDFNNKGDDFIFTVTNADKPVADKNSKRDLSELLNYLNNKVNFGEEVNKTFGDWELITFVDDVSFGSAWEDTPCMFIQIANDKLDKNYGVGDIESEEEFEHKKSSLISSLQKKERIGESMKISKNNLTEGYHEKAYKISQYLHRIMDNNPDIRRWSYDDYSVVPDWAGGGIRIQVEFDTKRSMDEDEADRIIADKYNDYSVKDKLNKRQELLSAKPWRSDDSVLKKLMRDVENHFYGVNCSTGFGRDWEYYFTINVDEKACNESLTEKQNFCDTMDCIDSGYDDTRRPWAEVKKEIIKKFTDKGHQNVKVERVQTDTKGLRMYYVYADKKSVNEAVSDGGAVEFHVKWNGGAITEKPFNTFEEAMEKCREWKAYGVVYCNKGNDGYGPFKEVWNVWDGKVAEIPENSNAESEETVDKSEVEDREAKNKEHLNKCRSDRQYCVQILSDPDNYTDAELVNAYRSFYHIIQYVRPDVVRTILKRTPFTKSNESLEEKKSKKRLINGGDPEYNRQMFNHMMGSGDMPKPPKGTEKIAGKGNADGSIGDICGAAPGASAGGGGGFGGGESLDTSKVKKGKRAKRAFADDPTEGMTKEDYIDWLVVEKGWSRENAIDYAKPFFESLNEDSDSAIIDSGYDDSEEPWKDVVNRLVRQYEKEGYNNVRISRTSSDKKGMRRYHVFADRKKGFMQK